MSEFRYTREDKTHRVSFQISDYKKGYAYLSLKGTGKTVKEAVANLEDAIEKTREFLEVIEKELDEKVKQCQTS